MWNTREEHGGVGAQNGCKQGKWHLTSCNLWTSFQRQETHRSYSGKGGRISHKDAGIRGTIHRMLVHQSHTETKKEKEKTVTSKSKHDEQCRGRETNQRQEVCVYVCQGKLCRMIVPKASTGWGVEVGGGPWIQAYSPHLKEPKITHTNTRTHWLSGEETPLNRIE